MTDRLKKILITIAVVVFILFALSLLGELEIKTPKAVRSRTTSSAPIAKKKATTLREIEEIDVNKKIFLGRVFRSLVNFEVEIFPEPTGRKNPFESLE